jgi:ABC-2 type transport system ATP-binding protein
MAINNHPQIVQAPIQAHLDIKGLSEHIPSPLIELHDLCKNYGTKTAVDHVNLNAFGGEVFGFLGPNGAGKTTTIKMIVGLLQPTSGTVKVAGYDMQKQALQAKLSSGYVPDTPNLYSKLSARELLRFVGDLYCMVPQQIDHRIEELLGLFSLVEAGDDLIDSYSHGMQQKASMAAALMHDPKVLVLDEPTVGLDPKSARLIKDVLRQFADRGSLVFVTTHILEIAERMCDRIGIINKGKLIAVRTMEELRAMGRGETSLEDIFLSLTGGPEEAEISEVMK